MNVWRWMAASVSLHLPSHKSMATKQHNIKVPESKHES
jgi:hypothetical protein